MAFQAHKVTGLNKIGIVFGAMDVMAGVAGNASSVHHALDEVIPLHTVFMRGAVRKMSKAGFAQLVPFQLPIIL